MSLSITTTDLLNVSTADDNHKSDLIYWSGVASIAILDEDDMVSDRVDNRQHNNQLRNMLMIK